MVVTSESHTRRRETERKKMTGMIEYALAQRYGPSEELSSESGPEQRWNSDERPLECILYKSLSWDDRLRTKYGVLEKLYGDARGGFLLGDSLKISLVEGPRVFGLYLIEELQSQAEVRRANELDSQICFFMDSANVWFYGLKDGELFVYDSGTQELGGLGPAQTTIQKLLIEFEEATYE